MASSSHCPHDETHRSRRRTYERWLSWLGVYPFRCARCGRRILRVCR